ncbi:DUF4349 domain-containing protein [Turneriella parva]|uniref:DUF4349 domain-containing protein n=1 Tax=Turneriella parva (strain ATCC BAA-1111 / DSM 21527 / NCTC 11395 / H) TaxID=869212 RepID=I4B5Z6_TURPD|nr:DUF4349 domain-containing protein [Turneriella parva]AFM12703.1 hypothetical protein Turpa_2057 [Turneriella parva DSM 21527]
MKKKILITSGLVAAIVIVALTFNRAANNFRQIKLGEFKKSESPASATAEEDSDEIRLNAATATAAPLAGSRREKDVAKNQQGHEPLLPLGPVFKPAVSSERRLEYRANLTYQIADLKAARAFFNQWIPRYGFLQSETASAHDNGYLTLTVKVRSSGLYAALAELDAIGTLAAENISVVDHTENAVYQQMLAEREQIRLRRRATAAAQNSAASRNWQATENLLAASEDKELQTRIADWRINDRVQWATITVQLTLPAAVKPAAIEVPLFQNAFVGVLNVLLQLLYLAIYLVPIAALVWLGWRASLRIIPALRTMPRA